VVGSIRLAAATAALVLASAAVAQQGGSAPKPITRAQAIATSDQAFGTVDTNHDGSLSTAEVQAAQTKELQQVQAALRARAEAQFKALDTNKDGQLSIPEFVAVVPTVKSNETAAQALQQIDSNHDGKVSAEEFRASRLAGFNKLDTNHDGTVSVQEQAAARQQSK
jgi:Ca2+-binding EF-hand superfamily protein